MQLKYQSRQKAILLLDDGRMFQGIARGKKGTSTGEICFNTGMTGYQEIFTDPSYYGQVVVMAAVHIGNYGVENLEVESANVKISGLVCKSFNESHSRKRANASLQEYLERNNVVAISDIDTRSLVRHIRSNGAMNCIISSEIEDVSVLKALLKNTPSMQGLELSSKVSCVSPYIKNEGGKYKVALLDLGVKENIIRCLVERDCEVKVFPMNTDLSELLSFKPNGIMISNGPGDPSVMKKETALIKSLIETGIPVFGICLGHQLISESQGIPTYKMHAGHRGINHPVKNLVTGKSEITSQNHGFSISADEVGKSNVVEASHVNLNDNTIEGIKLKDKPVFSVQYHPEAAPGPHDSRYLFDDFIKLMA